jgi:hypothetical protein
MIVLFHKYLLNSGVLTTLPAAQIAWRQSAQNDVNYERCGRKPQGPNVKYYPDVCMEGLNKTTKMPSQASRSARKI